MVSDKHLNKEGLYPILNLINSIYSHIGEKVVTYAFDNNLESYDKPLYIKEGLFEATFLPDYI